MKPQRLRTKLRKIREAGEAAAEEGGELNIIPYLDIVTNILMFLLATTTFAVALGDINAAQPTASNAVSPQPPDEQPKTDLNLTLVITGTGFTIATSGVTLYQGFSFDAAGNLVQTTQSIPTIPRLPNGDYDYATLAQKMLDIKHQPSAATEKKIYVNPNADITYDVVVQALDAARGKAVMVPDPDNPGKQIESYECFPDVVFSAGVN